MCGKSRRSIRAKKYCGWNVPVAPTLPVYNLGWIANTREQTFGAWVRYIKGHVERCLDLYILAQGSWDDLALTGQQAENIHILSLSRYIFNGLLAVAAS
jgi:hypothetical protein